MTNEEARRILQCLHDGFDPITGEVLPEEHICNSAQVLRALHRAILMLSGTEEHVVPDHEGKLNAGRPWTDEDCSALRDLYRSGCSMEEICAKLHRRKRGVVKQLSRLGLVPTKHARAGLPWTSEEDELLDDLLKCDYTIAQIAEKMERTSFAIFCRLEKRQAMPHGVKRICLAISFLHGDMKIPRSSVKCFSKGSLFRKWLYTFTVPKAAFPPDCFI